LTTSKVTLSFERKLTVESEEMDNRSKSEVDQWPTEGIENEVSSSCHVAISEGFP